MDDEKRKVLLENTDIVKEIHRHLWFESEKAGRERCDWVYIFYDIPNLMSNFHH